MKAKLNLIVITFLVAALLVGCAGKDTGQSSIDNMENIPESNAISEDSRSENNIAVVSGKPSESTPPAAEEKQPEPTPPADSEKPSEPAQEDITVYITKTGEKYHMEGCRSLQKSMISIKISEAKTKGYSPCGICKPPQ